MAAKKKSRKTKIVAATDAVDPNHENVIEVSVYYFSRKRGWIESATSSEVFKAGKTSQFSFHQTGTLPGQIETFAFRYSTDLQTFFWQIGYAATGNTVVAIADLAEKPDNEMQALLNAAVAGYQKIVTP